MTITIAVGIAVVFALVAAGFGFGFLFRGTTIAELTANLARVTKDLDRMKYLYRCLRLMAFAARADQLKGLRSLQIVDLIVSCKSISAFVLRLESLVHEDLANLFVSYARRLTTGEVYRNYANKATEETKDELFKLCVEFTEALLGVNANVK